MRNAENWPEGFTLSLPIMRIVFSFSHFGIQLTDCGLDKHPSFRIGDTARLYLRHAVTRDLLGLGLEYTNLRNQRPKSRTGFRQHGEAMRLKGNGGGRGEAEVVGTVTDREPRRRGRARPQL